MPQRNLPGSNAVSVDAARLVVNGRGMSYIDEGDRAGRPFFCFRVPYVGFLYAISSAADAAGIGRLCRTGLGRVIRIIRVDAALTMGITLRIWFR